MNQVDDMLRWGERWDLTSGGGQCNLSTGQFAPRGPPFTALSYEEIGETQI